MRIRKMKLLLCAAIACWATAIFAQSSTDQAQFPQVTAQPTDVEVPAGSNAVLTVQAANADGFQWYRNGVAMDGQTNNTLTIANASRNDVALYACAVCKNGEAVPTRAAALNVSMNGLEGGVITVFGTPILGGGGQGGGCPGQYAGYVNFTKTVSQGWGWAPTGAGHTATDTNRVDTKVQYVGAYGDVGCAQTTVNIPDPTFSPRYRFTIFFTNNVPTNSYAITLTGFNP